MSRTAFRPIPCLLSVLAALFALVVSRPAQAQAPPPGTVGGYPEVTLVAGGGAVLGATYVVVGTLGFAITDIHHLAKHKPFSPTLRWMQIVYGASLVGVGAVLANGGAHPGAVAPFLMVGAAFPTVALLEWNGQQQNRYARGRLSVGATGVSVAGSF